jgi:hypothetical protein
LPIKSDSKQVVLTLKTGNDNINQYFEKYSDWLNNFLRLGEQLMYFESIQNGLIWFIKDLKTMKVMGETVPKMLKEVHGGKMAFLTHMPEDFLDDITDLKNAFSLKIVSSNVPMKEVFGPAKAFALQISKNIHVQESENNTMDIDFGNRETLWDFISFLFRMLSLREKDKLKILDGVSKALKNA